MNSIFLCSILVFHLLIMFVINNKSFVSVSIITDVMLIFLLLVYIYIIKGNNFIDDISLGTSFTILLAILGYSIGEICSLFIGQRLFINKKDKSIRYSSIIDVHSFGIMIVSGVILLNGLVQFYLMYKFTEKMMNNHNILMTVVLIRSFMTSGEFVMPSIINIVNFFCKTSCYLFITYYLYNSIIMGYKKYKYLIPIVSYIIMLFSSTGRTGFIQVFSFYFIAYCLLTIIKDKQVHTKSSLKIVKSAIFVILIIMIFFFGYGFFIRKSTHTVAEYLNVYLGSALYGFDHISEIQGIRSEYFGQYTFQNIYYFLNKFWGNYSIPEHHLPFFKWGKINSNIYTGLMFPYIDFGNIGILCTRFLLGFLISLSTQIVCSNLFSFNKYRNIIFFVLTVDVYYSVINIPLADRFVDLISIISNFYFLFFIFINNYILVNWRKYYSGK